MQYWIPNPTRLWNKKGGLKVVLELRLVWTKQHLLVENQAGVARISRQTDLSCLIRDTPLPGWMDAKYLQKVMRLLQAKNKGIMMYMISLVSWSFTIKCLNMIYDICLKYFSTHSTFHNSHYVSNMEIWLKFLNLIFQSQHANAGNPSINLRNLPRSLCISSIQGGRLQDISGVVIPISRLIASATHAFLQGLWLHV